MTLQKKLGMLLITSALVAVPVVAAMIPATVKVADVESQQVAVGELVRLEVPGTKTEWLCLPNTEDMQVFDGNKLAISFRKAGHYTVVAASMVEGNLALYTIEIQVGNGPAPVSGLAANVATWCADASADKAVCSQAADIFERTADSPDPVKQAGSELRALTDTGFQTVLGRIQAYVARNGASRQVWMDIAQGLRDYAA